MLIVTLWVTSAICGLSDVVVARAVSLRCFETSRPRVIYLTETIQVAVNECRRVESFTVPVRAAGCPTSSCRRAPTRRRARTSTWTSSARSAVASTAPTSTASSSSIRWRSASSSSWPSSTARSVAVCGRPVSSTAAAS